MFTPLTYRFSYISAMYIHDFVLKIIQICSGYHIKSITTVMCDILHALFSIWKDENIETLVTSVLIHCYPIK